MHLRAKSLRLAVACAWACAWLGGCAGLPRIDPTGERVFIWPKDQPRVAAPLLAPSSTVVAPPVNTDPVFPAPAIVAAPATTTVMPGVTPAALALAQVPQDRVTISPERILAPVNSEVVLKAAVCTAEGYTLADQKVEWMLGRNGVGQFVEVSGKGLCHPPLLPWNQGKKIDNYLAQGWTASDDLCITRGTADPADDVNILRGDAWVTVTSPNEGTSHVTAFMPTVESWEQRRSSATIYWVDVQWSFPPPTVASDGRSATLTTTVTRQTNGTPIEGWLVRYELADGGGNLASGAGGQVVEVRTDANGQASVQATPTAAGAASTPVNIQLIRPAGFGGGDAPRLIVGSGTSTIQWSGGGAYLPPVTGGGPVTPVPTIPGTAPGTWQPPGTSGSTQPGGGVSIPPIPAARPQLDVELQADSMQPTVGGKMLLTLRLRNTGTARATGVQVIDQFDYPGLRYSRDPNATEVDANAPTTLEPGADISNPIEFDVARPGRLCHNVRVTSAEGSTDTAQLCVIAVEATVTAEGRVTVRKVGQPVAIVGEEITFRVTVENTGELPLVNVRVVDEYPPAYFQVRPPVGASVVSGKISYVIDRLERGQKKTFEDVRALCLQPAVPLIDRPVVTVEAETSPPTSLRKSADEVEMEIRPRNPAAGAGGAGGGAAAPGTTPALRVTTDFLQRPARANSRTMCEVAVVNSSQVDDEQIELRIVLPPQLTPDLSPAGGLAMPPGVRATMNDRSLNDRQLSFSPLATLRRGERQIYRIPMTVVGPAGVVEISADVRSRNYAGGAPQQPVQLEITNQ